MVYKSSLFFFPFSVLLYFYHFVCSMEWVIKGKVTSLLTLTFLGRHACTCFLFYFCSLHYLQEKEIILKFIKMRKVLTYSEASPLTILAHRSSLDLEKRLESNDTLDPERKIIGQFMSFVKNPIAYMIFLHLKLSTLNLTDVSHCGLHLQSVFRSSGIKIIINLCPGI